MKIIIALIFLFPAIVFGDNTSGNKTKDEFCKNLNRQASNEMILFNKVHYDFLEQRIYDLPLSDIENNIQFLSDRINTIKNIYEIYPKICK
jgi:hypothetical protein